AATESCSRACGQARQCRGGLERITPARGVDVREHAMRRDEHGCSRLLCAELWRHLLPPNVGGGLARSASRIQGVLCNAEQLRSRDMLRNSCAGSTMASAATRPTET